MKKSLTVTRILFFLMCLTAASFTASAQKKAGRDRQAPVYRLIAAYFERKISDGSLKENDRLPSTAELARSLESISKRCRPP